MIQQVLIGAKWLSAARNIPPYRRYSYSSALTRVQCQGAIKREQTLDRPVLEGSTDAAGEGDGIFDAGAAARAAIDDVVDKTSDHWQTVITAFDNMITNNCLGRRMGIHLLATLSSSISRALWSQSAAVLGNHSIEPHAYGLVHHAQPE